MLERNFSLGKKVLDLWGLRFRRVGLQSSFSTHPEIGPGNSLVSIFKGRGFIDKFQSLQLVMFPMAHRAR